jgi:transposase
MADMAKKLLRLKIPQLTEALQSHHMNEHHRWLIDQSIEHAKLLDQQVEELEKKIEQRLEPYRRQYELLMTIPGIQWIGAANILAEIGPNMDQFPTGDNLCSWAGICSGNNRSAGKSKSSHIKKANKFLLAGLVEAAWGAARKEGSVFQRKFRRWVKKLGVKKTSIAIGRSLLRVAWSVLKNDRPYVEPDNTVMKTLERQKQVRHHAHRLRQLGADQKTIEVPVEKLLEAPPPVPASQNIAPADTPDTSPARQSSPKCSPQGKESSSKRRPPARGVLGFPDSNRG